MKIRHILVAHQHEAEDILKLLSYGKSFSALAKKFSICPSGANGGNLGDISNKNMDQDFADAAKVLLPGQYSGVVRTKQGYHILQKIE